MGQSEAKMIITIDIDDEIFQRFIVNVSPITCIECRETFKSEDIREQIQIWLERKFFRRKLDLEVKDEIVDCVSPWYYNFKAGVDICFNCGKNDG